MLYKLTIIVNILFYELSHYLLYSVKTIYLFIIIYYYYNYYLLAILFIIMIIFKFIFILTYYFVNLL